MKTQKITEGEIEFYAPVGNKYETAVFYNPEGILIRDLTISAIQAFQKELKKKITVCDALSGTGISGLRYAKEITGLSKILLIDKNPVSVRLIKRNIKKNKLSKICDVVKEDANNILRKQIFNVIDLDPFGSPNTFLDSTAKSIYHKGFLAVTATDQAPLCGTYPLKCLKKYGIKTIRTEFYNELGIRVLISSIILTLAKHEKAFVPLLSFSSKHYYRVFGKIEGQSKLTEITKQFGYLNYCPTCGERTVGKLETHHKLGNKKHELKNCGLIYLGKINDVKFCKKVIKDIQKRNYKLKNRELSLLELIIEEASMSPFYYDIHRLAKRFKKQLPKMSYIIKKLNKKGFKTTRTHFSPLSLKTDAKIKDLKTILH